MLSDRYSVEQETTLIKQVDVIKYNYNNSERRACRLVLEFRRDQTLADIFYISKSGHKKCLYKNIIGVSYGTRSTTYANVDDCIPWLCVSLVRRDRTYDFQFNHHYELIWFLHHTNFIYAHNINYSLPLKLSNICEQQEKLYDETYVVYFTRILKFLKTQEFAKIYKIQPMSSYDCPICFEATTCNVRLKSCTHIFCKECMDSHIRYSLTNNKVDCPLCRKSSYIHLSFT